ncbi:MAG: hypothetical protein IJT50_16110 [Lentisphaeria bacterium]|nr:hypothetical protein [Lentisphaeria bacterium]
MNKFFTAVSAVLLGASLWGAEALDAKKAADFTGDVKDIKDVGGGVVRISTKKPAFRIRTKKIAIDPSQKYKLSVEYRKVPGSKSEGRFYCGPTNFDAQGREISCDSLFPVAGSETTLVTPVKVGDRIVRIKNGSKWQVKYGRIAFNVKNDLSDLPNFDLLRFSAIKPIGFVWEVTLSAPAPKAYPEGTAVRNHLDGASYRYLVGNAVPGDQWKKVERVVEGVSRDNVPEKNNSWRIGSVSAALVFFINGKDLDLEIRNVKITPIL